MPRRTVLVIDHDNVSENCAAGRQADTRDRPIVNGTEPRACKPSKFPGFHSVTGSPFRETRASLTRLEPSTEVTLLLRDEPRE